VTPVWGAVLAVGAATVAIKAAGPVLAAGRELPDRLGRVVVLLAPALLAALVATQAFSTERELVVDERAAGLLVAAAAVLLRAPLLAVVVAAAVTAAVLRALG
jgi:branched chain amino acid efflux pump